MHNLSIVTRSPFTYSLDRTFPTRAKFQHNNQAVKHSHHTSHNAIRNNSSLRSLAKLHSKPSIDNTQGNQSPSKPTVHIGKGTLAPMLAVMEMLQQAHNRLKQDETTNNHESDDRVVVVHQPRVLS